MVTPIVLDTDIGDDVDDALALGLICRCPEVQLRAVTTVYGNVQARARQARTVLAVAGDAYRNIPVAAGCGLTLASRKIPYDNAKLDHVPNQDSTCLPEAQLNPLDARHGVDLLIETLMGGDVIPITIGAMTNLAMALTREPRLLKKIPRIIAMAAEFTRPFAEWNILCDPEAAHAVFACGLPMDVITWDIGHTVRFTEEEVQRLNVPGKPLGLRLHAAIAAWRAGGNNPTARPSLFDPMTIATIVDPTLVQWKTGHVSVELRGEHTYGFTLFKEGQGHHRVAFDADRQRSIDFYLKRILS